MPADSSIYGQIAPVKPRNALADYAQVAQIQGLQQGNQLNALKMDEYKRGVEKQNALAGLLAGGADSQALRKGGFLKESLELDKAASDRAKTDADTAKARSEARMKGLTVLANMAGNAKDQAAWDLAFATAEALGEKVDGIPRQFNPQVASQVAGALTTQVQKWTDERAREQQAETQRHNKRTEGISGANLELRKQELEHSKNQPKGQFLETPQGYVLADPRAGTVQPVLGSDGKQLKGKSADKSLTDAQAKANLFGTRMKESDRILSSLEGKYNPMAVNSKMAAAEVPMVGGVAGYAGNLMLSSEGQQAEQAQRDFINAVLRRESGAVISPPEFENAKKQYFPQPGDTKDTLSQKKRNRALAIQGLEAEVPGGFRSGPMLTNPGNSGGVTGDFGDDPLGLRK